MRVNKTMLGCLLLLDIMLVVSSFYLSSNLPSYDPYSFFEDFDGSTINQAKWEFVGEGIYEICNSTLTITVPIDQNGALNHSFVKWSAVRESQAGIITMRFGLERFTDGGLHLKMLRLDGGWMGILDSKFVYYSFNGARAHILQSSIDNEWHIFKIKITDGEVEISWDGKFVSMIPEGYRYSQILLGHPDLERSDGGAFHIDWINVTSIHRYTPP